jgi:hypothetical protein
MSAPNAILISELSQAVLNSRAADQRRRRAPTALLFRFAFPGPWGDSLTAHARALARDIAAEPGLKWKIWLEDRKTGHAGGIYLFEDAVTAERYRQKHERRLLAMGLTDVTAGSFAVNTELSLLTMAAAALGQPRAPQAAAAAHALAATVPAA